MNEHSAAQFGYDKIEPPALIDDVESLFVAWFGHLLGSNNRLT